MMCIQPNQYVHDNFWVKHDEFAIDESIDDD